MNSDNHTMKVENGNSKLEIRNSNLAAWMSERIDPLIHWLIEPLQKLVRGPYALLAAVGLALVIGGLALHERDARLRRSFELEQLKTETAARVKELEERATAALRAANQRNALVIRELEASRLKLAKEGDKLRQRLAALQRDERVRVERVATLPSHELAERVATRLDAGAGKARDSGFAPLPVSASRDSGTNDHGTPSASSNAESPSPNPDARTAQPSLTLGADALRKVETAFVQLESCRQQGAVKDEQVANCREQLASRGAIAERMDDSLRSLNEAIHLKDEILARREAEHRAELKAARGSRWDRMRKALTYVAVGVVTGVVVAR